MQKLRTIITQDAEVDDQNSLRHFLFYANEAELEGIVQTSSKFHWQGVPGAVCTETVPAGGKPIPPYDRPYRWPGTDWMQRVLDDYAADFPRLRQHSPDYPAPEALRAVTKVGNIGYKGEMEQPSEGSELIRRAILRDDPRPLYIQVWGGCNTIARALLDIETAYADTPAWPALHAAISRRVILTACGEQDETYRTYIAERWPEIQFVKTLQMFSYGYPWFTMPDCESRDTLTADFMRREILSGSGALAAGYCTWLDGNRYEGEPEKAQFGANPNIREEWFGAKLFSYRPEPYDFLSEGDSPTYFALLPWGLRTLEDFRNGGAAGRYRRAEGEVNSKGQPLNIWEVVKDRFTARDGSVHLLESMWPYVADIQRDFAARVHWAGTDSFAQGEHAPALALAEGVDRTAAPGEALTLTAAAHSPDGLPVTVSFSLYADASAPCAARAVLTAEDSTARLTIPADAAPGDRLHVIVKAQAAGHYRLVHYQQVIVTIA